MKAAISLSPLAFAALTFASCATSSHVVVGTKRAAINPEDVRLYLTPPPKYEEVAVLDSTSRGAFALGDQAKIDKAIARLKREAASLGANGILLRGTGEQQGPTVGTTFSTAQAYGSGGRAYGYGTGTTVFSSARFKTAQGVAIYVPDR
jgi:hypothetical protein